MLNNTSMNPVLKYSPAFESCWNLLKFVEICWNLLKSVEMCWYVLKFVDTCWNQDLFIFQRHNSNCLSVGLKVGVWRTFVLILFTVLKLITIITFIFEWASTTPVKMPTTKISYYYSLLTSDYFLVLLLIRQRI